MSDTEYLDKLWKLIQSIDQDEERIIKWSDHFEKKTKHVSFPDDGRQSERDKIGTPGVLWFEKSHLPRTASHIGIHTCDLSPDGACFMAPLQAFANEIVRIALPMQWARLRVVRADKVSEGCYEIGGEVIERHEPGMDAFGVTKA